MKIKQILTTLLVFTLVAAGCAALSSMPAAQAKIGNDGWCEQNSNIGDATTDNCLSIYDTLTPDQKAAVGGPQGFQNAAQACMTTGSYYGMQGNDGGSCANAVKYCYTRAIDPEGCKNNDRIGQIAKGCNQGKDTNENGCDPIKDINKPIVDGMQDKMKQLMEDTCKPKEGETESAAFSRCQQASQAAIDYCGDQSRQPGFEPIEGDGDYRLADKAAYEKCLNDKMRQSAQGKDECVGRGGIWADKDMADPNDPNGNTVTRGCKADIKEMMNPAACEAASTPDARTKWVKINDPKNPNRWECQYENPEDDPNNQNDGIPDGAGIPGNEGQFQNCGTAQTNLVSCDASTFDCSGSSNGTTGTPVLGCILRFGVQALTVLVGIGAVAGIAWESVQYARAQDNESIVANARGRIRDIVIGLVVYGFMIAIIQWLVPGGVF